MSQLAIKGHATRGREVIQLLEMLGGKSNSNMNGYNDDLYYFIAKDGLIYGSDIEYEELNCKYTIFTLEEFLEKFPYKVGDKVNSPVKVVNDLQPYKEETMEEDKKAKGYCTEEPEDSGKAKKIAWFTFWDNDFADEVELYLKDRELVQKEGKWFVVKKNSSQVNLKELERKLDEALEKETTESLNKWLDEEPEPEPKAPILSNRYDYAEGKCGYVIPDGYEFDYIKDGFQTEIILKPKKPQYPKTYEECCQHLGCDDKLNVGELIPFQQLVNARNAYWKIAGKQLGLDKSWKPDWESETEQKYTIVTDANEICSGVTIQCNAILAFPTKEMRDAFYKNFKELIEQCKELL